MSTLQKAIVVTEVGKPVVLIDNQPIPQPGPNQVQIKVSVAGLNPHDQKMRDFGMFVTEGSLPQVMANDVVGVITQLGEGVEGQYAVGDRVVSHARMGAWTEPKSSETGLQEYALANVGAMAKVPAGVSDDEAATLPINVMPSVVALYRVLGIPAPWTDAAAGFDYAHTTLLIIGGGSNNGRFGVQIAKLAGVGRIVVVGGDEAELKSYGATHVLDRHGGADAVLGRIRAVVGDDLVYAYDTVNDPAGQTLGLNALSSSKKGAMARLVPTGPVDEPLVAGKEAGFELRDAIGMSVYQKDEALEFWNRLPGYLEFGQIKPLKFEVKGFSAADVNEVLDAYRDGKTVTKTHIHF
ncbi:Enoyl LovC [Apiospora kogelbergensis]|uniref:Enoyl LovC n=1 Tax=Apiospora kogelbergensis TaxID=1337665 RepID=UPI00313092E2